MADKYPLANGNWSDAGNWNGGTLPDVTDDVYADGRTLTIDQDVEVLSLRTTARSGGTAGGTIQITGGPFTVELTGLGIVPGTTAGLVISSASTGVLNVVIGDVANGSTSTANGISYTGSCDVSYTGGVLTGGGHSGSYGISITGSGAFTVETGSTFTVAGTTGGAMIINNSNAVVEINADCPAGISAVCTTASNLTLLTINGNVSGAGASGKHGLNLTAATGNCIINGIVTGGSSSTGAGVNKTSGSTLTINGDVVGLGYYALNNAGTGTITITGELINNGFPAILNSSTGTINATGNASHTASSNNTVVSLSNGVVNITGNATGGTAGSSASAVTCSSLGVCTINGDVLGGSLGPGVICSTGTVVINGVSCGGTGSGAYGAWLSGSGSITVLKAKGNNYGLGGSGSTFVEGAYNSANTGTFKVKQIEYGAYGCSPTRGAILIEPDAGNEAVFRETPGGATLTLDPVGGGGGGGETSSGYMA